MVEGGGGFGGLEGGVVDAEPFSERRCVALLRCRGTVKRVARARVDGFGGVEEFFECAADVRGEFAGGRVAPEIVGELLALAFDPDRALLQVARRADRPGEVAKVSPDLALDGRYRKRAEGRANRWVIAVQRLQQPECGDLLEVFQRTRLPRSKRRAIELASGK